MNEPKKIEVLCDRCQQPIGRDIFISPSGQFYCADCKTAAADPKKAK